MAKRTRAKRKSCQHTAVITNNLLGKGAGYTSASSRCGYCKSSRGTGSRGTRRRTARPPPPSASVMRCRTSTARSCRHSSTSCASARRSSPRPRSRASCATRPPGKPCCRRARCARPLPPHMHGAHACVKVSWRAPRRRCRGEHCGHGECSSAAWPLGKKVRPELQTAALLQGAVGDKCCSNSVLAIIAYRAWAMAMHCRCSEPAGYTCLPAAET